MIRGAYWLAGLLLLVGGRAAIAAEGEAPSATAEVFAPVRVAESPANEAVVLRLPDDSMRVYYILRPSGEELRSIGSHDGGFTWGDDRLEFKLPGAAYYAVQVAIDHAGEVQAIFHIRGEGNRGYRGRHYNVWHNRTEGGRSRWGEPKQILEGYVGSLRGFAVLRSGRLLLPMGVAVSERQQAPSSGPDYGWNDVAVMISDDRGATWRTSPDRLKVVQDNTRGRTRYGAVEPAVRELEDGRVWMLIRTKNGHLYESYSTDGGERWPQPEPSRLISSDSPAATVRLSDGRLVLFLNACQRWDDPMSYAVGGREALHAAISDDEGATWRGFREVLRDLRGDAKGDRGTAYPSAAETADGKIVLVSGQGEERKSILLLDPDWLEEVRHADAFDDGLGGWTTFGGRGSELIAHPDKTDAQVLLIAKTDADAEGGATWNFPAGAAGELRLRVRPREGWRGTTLSLTDHFSVIADTAAAENAVYTVALGAVAGGVELSADRWHDLTLTWKADGSASLVVDGGTTHELPRLREPAFGVNYLRLVSAADAADPAGLLVEHVAVEVTPPGKGERSISAAEPRTANHTAPSIPSTLTFRKIPGDAGEGAVLAPTGGDEFDAAWVSCPYVIRDGDGYRMWYSSYYTDKFGVGGIGLATSDDGRHWRRARGGEPVLTPGPTGSFDAQQILSPEVHFDGRLYRMWYTGQSDRQHPSGIVTYQIGLATSTDGVTWQRANGGEPVLTHGPAGAPDEVQAATPCVLREGDGWRMWYAAWAPHTNHTICVARSDDGVHWTRENDGKPVEGLQPPIAYGHCVTRVGDEYLMLYMALEATRHLYAARSDDGLHWTMLNGGEPVLEADGEGFDAYIVGHPHLMVDGGVLRVWYTGYRRADRGLRLGVGLAEAVLRP